MPQIKCSHNEANTRKIFHAQDAGGLCVIHSGYTGVQILLLSHSQAFGKCYIKKGRSTKTTMVEQSIVAEGLFKQLSPGISEQHFLKAVIEVHALSDVARYRHFLERESGRQSKYFSRMKVM